MDSSGRKIGRDARVTSDHSSSELPALIWAGDEFGISWINNEKVHFARLGSAGDKIGHEVQITKDPSYSSTPCLIKADSDYVISWEDYKNKNYRIHLAKLGPF